MEWEPSGERLPNLNKVLFRIMSDDEETEHFAIVGSHDSLTKPGQKYPTPSPGNGDRVFYESLLVQDPSSPMAQEWCVYYGILDDARATELYAIILKRKGQAAPSTTSSAKAKATASGTKAKATVNPDKISSFTLP